MQRIPGGSSTGLRWGALGCVLAIMLYAGLNLRGFAFRNTAALRRDPPGLIFGAHGLAFTRPFVSADDAREVARDGLTLALELEVAAKPPDGFAAIAVLHNGSDADQLFLGQWQRHLILLNGDDYDHRRRLPRTSVDTAKLPPGRLHLLITSDSSGCTFFANGKKVDRRRDFVQSVPVGARLTLGNSPSGKNPWNGTLHRFALYRRSLEPGELPAVFQLQPQTGAGNHPGPASPWLSYRFEPDQGHVEPARHVTDASGNAIDLEFPLDTAFLSSKFLGREEGVPVTGKIISRDGLLNLFGFMPLGWIVAGLIGSRQNRPSGLIIIMGATTVGILLSLGIEYLQTWIPTRSSHLMDLVLNSGGALSGAILGCLVAALRRPGAAGSAPGH